MKIHGSLSDARMRRLQAQGFTGFTRFQLNNYKYGIRFAYYLCVSLVIAGLILQSMYVLALAMIFAFFGTVLHRHPFDYLYNYGVRRIINKPAIPPRPNQSRFACGLATAMILAIMLFLSGEQYVLMYITGVALVATALLVATTDYCIPSIAYNAIAHKRNQKADASHIS